MKSQKGTFIAGILLAVILLISVLTGFFGLIHLKSLASERNFWITRTLMWVVLSIVFLFARNVEKKPFLLWKEQKKKPLFYFVSVIMVLVITLIFTAGVSILEKKFGMVENNKTLHEMMALLCTNKLLLVFTCITAAFTEELIFRGYLLPRLEVLLKNKWWAIIISALLFGIAHGGYGDLNRMLMPFIIGIIFALYYFRYRSLTVLIICHFLIDFYSLYGSCK